MSKMMNANVSLTSCVDSWAKSSTNTPRSIEMAELFLRAFADELTRYLSDNWRPMIEKDVDGPNSLPLRIDSEKPSLSRYSACRRVVRTVYLGSAPTVTAANRRLEDRRIKLGCVQPGEAP